MSTIESILQRKLRAMVDADNVESPKRRRLGRYLVEVFLADIADLKPLTALDLLVIEHAVSRFLKGETSLAYDPVNDWLEIPPCCKNTPKENANSGTTKANATTDSNKHVSIPINP